MYTALFYYTLCIMLGCTLTAATCFSAYLVSRNRTFLYATIMFLSYFFDVALVFQDDFLRDVVTYPQSSFWAIGNPVPTIVTGVGTFLFLWLAICSYLGERRPVVRFAPVIVWAAASIAVLLAPIDDMRIREFCFYDLREVLLFWMYGYLLLRFATCRDEVLRARMSRHGWLLPIAFLLTIGIVVENVYFQLLFAPQSENGMWFFAERNLFENMLFVAFAVLAVGSATKSLSMRFHKPPTAGDEETSVNASISHNLPYYCKVHGLSERESEVLELILQGKDNQNIASALQLSPSTVKVHVHNILKKTELKNRQELTRDFWRH